MRRNPWRVGIRQQQLTTTSGSSARTGRTYGKQSSKFLYKGETASARERGTAATTVQTFRIVRGDLRDTHLSQLASERGSQNPKRNKPPSRVRARRGSSAGGLRRTRPRGASSRWAAAATRYDGGSCTGGEWGGRGVRGGWNVWGIWRQAGPHWGGHRRAGGVWSAHENVCMEICG